jgi:hypothetical protein
MGVVIEICVKHSGRSTRMRVTDVYIVQYGTILYGIAYYCADVLIHRRDVFIR